MGFEQVFPETSFSLLFIYSNIAHLRYEGGFAGAPGNAFCIASISVAKVCQSPLGEAAGSTLTILSIALTRGPNQTNCSLECGADAQPDSLHLQEIALCPLLFEAPTAGSRIAGLSCYGCAPASTTAPFRR